MQSYLYVTIKLYRKYFLGFQRRNTFYTGPNLPTNFIIFYFGSCGPLVIVGGHKEDKIHSWNIRNIYGLYVIYQHYGPGLWINQYLR